MGSLSNRNIVILALLFFISSCSNIHFLSKKERADLYRNDFMKTIKVIKNHYAKGNKKRAIKKLRLLKNEELWPAEKAFKYNLIGVILFSSDKYEEAISSFDNALASSSVDDTLTSQINLNMASCYYKLDFTEKSYAVLMKVTSELLSQKESIKFHYLHYSLAKTLGKDKEMLVALTYYFGSRKTINDVRTDTLFQYLLASFFKMEFSKRARFLEEMSSKKIISVGYLAYLNAEKIYYEGERSDAKDYLKWLEDEYKDFPDLIELVKNFSYRLDSATRMNSRAIGVILPLSGRKKNFGKRALIGIDSALKKINKQLVSAGKKPLVLFIKDSKGSSVIGSYRVKELIEENSVVAVVGGLFSNEAIKQYREAKKRGVFYISLSQVYLSKLQKNHLLLEIPGSIESQINEIFSERMLSYFGRKAAIIYPNSDRGKSYLDEFWRKSVEKNVQISGIQSYNEKSKDFRAPVKAILGLKFSRERQEELDILSEIFSLKRKRSVKRLNILGPQIDFDWLFLPSYPDQARLIIPSFSYFDAFKLKILGGPSWGKSKKLVKEGNKYNKLYFVSDEIKKLSDNFITNFSKIYRRNPGFLEMISYDSMLLLGNLLKGNEFNSRDDFDISLKERKRFKGITGTWFQADGIWLKKMEPMQLRKGNISKLLGGTKTID